MTTAMEERRIHPRLPLPLAAVIVVDGEQRLATMEDLSAGGSGIRVTEELAVGQEIDELSFVLPADEDDDNRKIAVRAEVVYSGKAEQAEGDGGFRAGLRFIDLDEKWHKRIQQYIYRTLTKGRPQADEMPLERRRVALQQPVSIRFDRFDAFVSEVSENLSVSGMFIRTNAPKPPGTVFQFSFQLGDDFALVEGRAEVVWTRRRSLDAQRPAGMGVRFFDLDDRSRNTILSLIAKSSEKKSAQAPQAQAGESAPTEARPTQLGDLSEVRGDGETVVEDITDDSSRIESLRQELARRTKRYEARVGKLEERIAELTSRQVDVDTERRQADSSAAELQSLNELLEKRLADTEEQGRQLQEQVDAAESRLKELGEEVEVHRSEADTRRRKASSLENQLLSVEQALRAAETERDEISTRLKEGGERRKELEAMIERLESSDEKEQRNQLQEELKESRMRIGVLEDRLAAAETERDTAAARIAELESLEEGQRREAQEAARAIVELQGALKEAKEAAAQMASEGESRLAESQRLTEEVESARLRLEEEIERQKVDFEERLAGERVAAGEEVEALKEQVDSLAASVEDEARKRHDVEEELRRTEDELERSLSEHQEIESGLRQEALTAVAAAESARQSLAGLETSFSEADRERTRLQSELENSREEIVTLREEGAQRENDLRTRADEATAEVEGLNSRVASLEDSLEEAETARHDLTQQIEKLRARSLKAEENLTTSGLEMDQLRADTESRVGELESRLAEAQSAAEDRQQAVVHLEALLSNAELDNGETVRQLKLDASALEERLAGQESRANDLQAELDKVRTSEAGARDELERATGVIETLRSDLESAHTEMLEQKEQARTNETALREELAEVIETRARLEDALAASESAAREDLAGDVLTVASDVAGDEQEMLRQEISTLQATVRGLSTELESRRSDELDSASASGASSARRRLRAAGLVAAGLAAGALLIGPVSRVVPLDRWLGGSGAPEGAVEVAEVAASGQQVVDAASGPDESDHSDAEVEFVGEPASESEVESKPEAPPPSYPQPSVIAQAWAAAWSAQDVEGYLGHYARAFEPPNGASRRAWEAYRRERLTAPASISVVLSDMTETVIDDDRIEVSFDQAYSAGSYSDRVRKTLVLIREDGTWKIVSEQSTPL